MHVCMFMYAISCCSLRALSLLSFISIKKCRVCHEIVAYELLNWCHSFHLGAHYVCDKINPVIPKNSLALIGLVNAYVSD